MLGEADALDESQTQAAVALADGVAIDVSPEFVDALGADISADISTERIPSRWFYGWLMLPLAMSMMIATSPGQTFGFSFFNAEFRNAFSLSQTRLSAVYLVATVIASLALPTIGALIDRFGLRRSALVAVAGLAAVCVFMSQVQGVAMLFTAFVLFRILGPGTMTLLANNTLAAWFDRRLGIASGMMQLSMACATAFVPVSIVFLIDSFGWRGAYLGIAAVLAGGLLPLLALVYRESPALLGQYPDGHRPLPGDKPRRVNATGLTVQQAMQQRSYWILLASTATWALIGTGFVFHLEALFQAHGLDKGASARAMTCLAIGMGASQIFGGLLADRIALRWLVVTAVGLIATSCVMLALGRTSYLVPSFAVYGVGQGLKSIVAGTGWARYFGRAHLGKIRGMSLTAAIAGSSVGPLMMGVADDYLGSFSPALWLFAGMATLVAIAGFWATPPERIDEPAI